MPRMRHTHPKSAIVCDNTPTYFMANAMPHMRHTHPLSAIVCDNTLT